MLPCEVRVTGSRHPLFGRLLSAVSFKRRGGVLLLVVTLPDGSPGTVPADSTGVFGDPYAAAVGVGVRRAGLESGDR